MPSRTVLVIDDDPCLRELYTTVLSASDPTATILSAGSAEEGLAAAVASNPGLIYLDHRLPGQLGVDAVPAFRAACPAAVIVVVSGWADAELPERARSAGADSFLDKGELLGNLAAAIRPPVS